MATSPPVAGGPRAEASVSTALHAVRELMGIFRFERIVYLIGAGAGIALLLYAAWRTINSPELDPKSIGYLFGSGGLFAITGARVLYLLNRSFSLIERVVLSPEDAGSDK